MQRAHLLEAKAIAVTQVLKTNRSRFGKLPGGECEACMVFLPHRSYEIPDLFKGHQVDGVAAHQRFLWLRKLLVQRPQWAPRLRVSMLKI